LSSRYAEARRNLWGKPTKPQKAIQRPVEPPPEAEATTLPQTVFPPLPSPSMALLKPHEGPPKPSKEELDELLADDDRVWREGVKEILLAYGENMRRLTSMQRDSHILECRVAVATYLRNRGWSYPRIGEFMKRDHTSIIYLISPDMKKARLRKQAYERNVVWRAHRQRADVGERPEPVVEDVADCPGAVFSAHGWIKPERSGGDEPPRD